MRVPIRTVRTTDMRLRPDGDRGIQAAGGHHQQRPRHLQLRQGGTAFGAEAFLMPCAGHAIGFDLVLPGEPGEARRGRKQIGAVGGAAVLAAARTVAEEKLLERAGDLKSDRAAKTRTRNVSGHVYPLSTRPRAGRWPAPAAGSESRPVPPAEWQARAHPNHRGRSGKSRPHRRNRWDRSGPHR